MGFQREDLSDEWVGSGKVDIMVAHCGPQGYGDQVFLGTNVGCPHLLKAVEQRIKPALFVSGHIHEDYGTWTHGETTFVNAATCNLIYNCRHAPVVVMYGID